MSHARYTLNLCCQKGIKVSEACWGKPGKLLHHRLATAEIVLHVHYWLLCNPPLPILRLGSSIQGINPRVTISCFFHFLCQPLVRYSACKSSTMTQGYQSWKHLTHIRRPGQQLRFYLKLASASRICPGGCLAPNSWRIWTFGCEQCRTRIASKWRMSSNITTSNKCWNHTLWTLWCIMPWPRSSSSSAALVESGCMLGSSEA